MSMNTINDHYVSHLPIKHVLLYLEEPVMEGNSYKYPPHIILLKHEKLSFLH